MKKFYLLGLAALSFLAYSCNMEETEPLMREVTISASVEKETDTRSTMDDIRILWAEDDAISVWTGTKFSEFTLDKGAGTTSGTFKAILTGDENATNIAVYPAGLHQCSGSSITAVKYPAVYGNAGNAYSANTNALMVSDGSSEASNMLFKHVGGVIEITIVNLPKEATAVKLATDKVITGDFELVDNADGDYAKTETTSETNNSITINFAASENERGTQVFYFPVPTGTYGTLKLGYYINDIYEEIVSSTSSNTINRKTILAMPAIKFAQVGGGTESTEKNAVVEEGQNNASEVLNTVVSGSESNPDVNLTTPASATTVTLPSAFTSGSTTESNLNMNYSAAPSTLSVTETDADSKQPAESKGDVNVNIPTNGSDAEIDEVNINTPTLTTSVNATGDNTLTIENMTATTANNTLVIGANVTITNLTIEGGNVFIDNGAEVTNLSVKNGITITVYDANETQMSDGSGYIVKSAEEYYLREAFKDGGTYTLGSDVDITTTDAELKLHAGKSLVLDLNGHTIKANNREVGNIDVYGTLTIKDMSAGGNGKITAVEKYIGSANGYGVIEIRNGGAELILESGLIDTSLPNPSEGQFGVGINWGAKFTMTGGEIKAGWFGISGNGQDTKYNNIINIQGGKISSTYDYAMYLPQTGTTTITGGTITGVKGAIDIQRGTLNISGESTIIESSAPADPDVDGDINNDGTAGHKAGAVNVAGEYGDVTINITGGKFITNNTSVFVTESDKYARNITISGGTFSDLSALQYIADNASIAISKNTSLADGIQIPSGKNVGIDLAQQTLTLGAQSKISGILKLKNGSVSDCIGGIAVYADNAEVHFDGIKYTAPETGQGVFNAMHTQYGVIDIKNSEIKSGYFAVSSNAMTDKEGHVTINLYNSKFTADETAFMVNIPTKVTIDKCEFTGGWQGVFVRSCPDVTITNSSITLAEGTKSPTAQGTVWSDGNKAPSAALTMGNRTSAEKYYNHATDVKLENVTFKSTDNYPAVYIDMNTDFAAQSATLKVDQVTRESAENNGGFVYDSTNAKITVNLPVDLSTAGTANCYIVSSAGNYKFKAVKGNSERRSELLKKLKFFGRLSEHQKRLQRTSL